jgi:hypothetical protein
MELSDHTVVNIPSDIKIANRLEKWKLYIQANNEISILEISEAEILMHEAVICIISLLFPLYILGPSALISESLLTFAGQ